MVNYADNVHAILEKAGIEKGLLIDCTGYFESEDLGRKIKIEKKSFEKAEEFLNNETDVKGIFVEENMISRFEEEFCEGVYEKIKQSRIVLFVCGRNPLTRDEVFEILSGQRTEFLNIQGYTKAGLCSVMDKLGFELIAEENAESKKAEIMSDNTLLARESTVHRYLAWLEQYISAGLTAEYYIQAYQACGRKAVSGSGNKNDAPFLSIVTRTQGRRLEALRETFLSLEGQECLDFEVLVMGHNLNDEERRKVESVIEETPKYFREKVRLIQVVGGNRSTPLNKGFEAARGEYAVILDDDDIVFDHWVSSFKEKAEKYPGRVIHAYVIAQEWYSFQTSAGKESLRAGGSPQNQFCRDFHLINELNGNYCPVLGLAFPLYPFRKMNMRFDETLDTAEDWDFLMRVSCICGVVDVKEPTSMYRLWKNAENSHSLHSEKEWVNNTNRIRKRFRNKPLLLPVEYIDEMIQIAEKNASFYGTKVEERGQVTPLYYDNGSGFNERCVKRTGSRKALPEIYYEFVDFEIEGLISSIRWDPNETGYIFVENVRILITTDDGKVIEKKIPQMNTNGLKNRNQIVFFHPDPQIVIHFNKKIRISKIVITGTLRNDITEDMHNSIALQYNSSVVRKTKKAVKAVGKKILRKY